MYKACVWEQLDKYVDRSEEQTLVAPGRLTFAVTKAHEHGIYQFAETDPVFAGKPGEIRLRVIVPEFVLGIGGEITNQRLQRLSLNVLGQVGLVKQGRQETRFFRYRDRRMRIEYQTQQRGARALRANDEYGWLVAAF